MVAIRRVGAVLVLGATAAIGWADTLLVPGGYATIQEAINAADDGDVVLVAPGTYDENLDLPGKEIVLRSSHGAAETVLTAMGGPLLRCDAGAPSAPHVEGFTFFNSYGSAIFVDESLITFAACVFRGNFDESRGGAGRLINSEVGFERCHFSRNLVNGMHSLASGGALYMSGGSLRLVECDFQENSTVSDDSRDGSAVSFRGDALTMIGCRFEANGSSLGYGEVAVHASAAMAILEDCTFASNLGRGCLLECNEVTTRRCTFEFNANGGALIDAETAIVEECRFLMNECLSHGAGLSCTADQTARIDDCEFVENHASGVGGGMSLWADTGLVSRSRFTNNLSDSGGGLFLGLPPGGNAVGKVYNSLFCGNIAQFLGGAIVSEASSAEVRYSTLTENEAFLGPAIVADQSNVEVRSSIVWANGASPLIGIAGSVYANCSDVEGGTYGSSNIDADPLFIDPSSSNFRLQAVSPCIDTGCGLHAPDDSYDLDHLPRIQDGDGDGIPVIDMGAYEYRQGQGPCIADLDGDGDTDQSDLGLLLIAYGLTDGGDIDDDGDTDQADLGLLLNDYDCGV